jgi:Tfp pilus assembly protein PilO
MILWKRILVEKRALIIPLAIAILANVGVYALVVYPLGVKSAGAADRAAAASVSVKAAERDFAAAKALVAGKSRAEDELTTFYDKVLPADQAAARRLTYASLPSLAKKSNVRFEARRTEPEPPERDARLGRLQIKVTLQGEWENFRQFIYELEAAPEFVIIDNVTLAQTEANKPLTFTVDLSTYYRLGANGN